MHPYFTRLSKSFLFYLRCQTCRISTYVVKDAIMSLSASSQTWPKPYNKLQLPVHCGISGNEQEDILAKEGVRGEQHGRNVSFSEKKILVRALTMPWSQRDDYHLLSREQQVVLVRFRAGHIRLNSHMHGKLKLASLTNLPLWSRRQNYRYYSSAKMPPSQSHKRRRVACQHSPDDQTLRLQTGAGEDDAIHLPSGLDRVACERQEEEKDSTHFTCVAEDVFILPMLSGTFCFINVAKNTLFT